MPIYEYICKDCGTKFELIRPAREMDAPAECPGCAKSDSHRQFSTFAAPPKATACGSSCGARPSACEGCACGH